MEECEIAESLERLAKSLKKMSKGKCESGKGEGKEKGKKGKKGKSKAKAKSSAKAGGGKAKAESDSEAEVGGGTRSDYDQYSEGSSNRMGGNGNQHEEFVSFML